jgi:hypothetical protein
MIELDNARWFAIAKQIRDESAGAIEDQPFQMTRTGNVIALTFNTPQDETWFRLKFTS